MTAPSFGSDASPRAGGAVPARRWWRAWPWLLIGLVVFVFVAFVILLIRGGWMQSVQPRPFDRAEWLDVGWKDRFAIHPARQEMVDDLLETKLKVGMSMSEVHWLIGPPDKHPYFKPGDWTYELGLERGFIAVDNEWLAIDFDELGRIRRAELETD
jgi:hypothetical protein